MNKLFELHDSLNLEYNKLYIYNFLIHHNIHKSWYPLFYSIDDKFITLLESSEKERLTKIIYPKSKDVFKVFRCSIDNIKIVLIGQDPYHQVGEAMGLSFSVPKNVKIPPSLVNIFKELNNEFPNKYNFTHGDLTRWFNNGVFLLNSALTVIDSKPNSHQYIWDWFTDLVISYIDNNRKNVVFLLLGRNAKSKRKFINDEKNHIIEGVHPSPLSAYNGFFNSNIFMEIDKKLDKPFDWFN